MTPVTAQMLIALNRAFYLDHAAAFTATRPRLRPQIARWLAQMPPGARVLELGCGDGKVARRLAGGVYVGVDISPAMLQLAVQRNQQAPPTAVCHWVCADVADPHWPTRLPLTTFDVVVALAVWQHLPGLALRHRVTGQVAGLLAPGGWLMWSHWQLSRDPARLARLARPWAALGLTPAEVEPGDYLLSWERAGRTGLRYVHEITAAETRALLAHAGLTLHQIHISADPAERLADDVLAQKIE